MTFVNLILSKLKSPALIGNQFDEEKRVTLQIYD